MWYAVGWDVWNRGHLGLVGLRVGLVCVGVGRGLMDGESGGRCGVGVEWSRVGCGLKGHVGLDAVGVGWDSGGCDRLGLGVGVGVGIGCDGLGCGRCS